MGLNSPLFDKVRIKPRCEQPRQEAAVCERAGCSEPGLHRAPKGRGREGEYWRFCLSHVREYNAAYNYFSGMSDEDVQQYQKEAAVGHRPTWNMSVNGGRRRRDGAANPEEFDYLDPLGVMRSAGFEGTRATPEPAKPRRPGPVMAALETLGLDESAGAVEIKAQYKVLVKRFHPDAHGGDRSYEPRLRDIINAHDTLKAAGLC
ncbi:J domain-containing protein [Enterovirga sp. CN4-39]|uniref:J domain-containing protein n=1 Tax=Enterovirga sp. CN4-39 TaxID=3400910 RepID=UPI003C0DAC85